MGDLNEDEFARWLRPADALARLPAEWDLAQKRRAIVLRLSQSLIKAAARGGTVWDQRTAKPLRFGLIDKRFWGGNFGMPTDQFWQVGDAEFDNGHPIDSPRVYFDDDPTDKYASTAGCTLLDVRLNPEDFHAEFGQKSNPMPAASAGRKAASWWPAFSEEIAVYVHEEGLPDGDGSEGQEQVIRAILQRLSDRNIDASRTSIQPVIKAILARLRSARN